jgi:hypothetical protein
LLVPRIGAGSFATTSPTSVSQSPPSGFEPATPYHAPVGSPAFQPSDVLTPSRPVSYYILLGVSALALFAISMFLTILVLS